MDEQQITRIKDFLIKNGLGLDTITKHRLNQFKKVDGAIQSRLKTINEAKETIKEMVINIVAISEASGISRKTFYNNNQLLKKFVDTYNAGNEERSVDGEKYEKVIEKNRLYKRQIQDFILRDIEIENLRHEVNSLHKELEMYITRNKALEEENEKNIMEISKLKRKNANSSNVVQLRDASKKNPND